MSENKLTNMVMDKFNAMLDEFKRDPSKMTDSDRSFLEKLYSQICKSLGISEHSQWRVTWEVRKWMDEAKRIAGLEPDEVCTETQNIILDAGANEMLKLITGTGGTAFSAANTYLYVGSDSSPENAAQTGVLATGNNRAYAAVDSGYPSVTGRQMVYQATFGNNDANFAWNEASIVNGTGVNAVAMNRKVSSFGTKTQGSWSLRITVSLTSV